MVQCVPASVASFLRTLINLIQHKRWQSQVLSISMEAAKTRLSILGAQLGAVTMSEPNLATMKPGGAQQAQPSQPGPSTSGSKFAHVPQVRTVASVACHR